MSLRGRITGWMIRVGPTGGEKTQRCGVARGWCQGKRRYATALRRVTQGLILTMMTYFSAGFELDTVRVAAGRSFRELRVA